MYNIEQCLCIYHICNLFILRHLKDLAYAIVGWELASPHPLGQAGNMETQAGVDAAILRHISSLGNIKCCSERPSIN